MSEFRKQMYSEALCRLENYQREKDALQKAAVRIKELDVLIADAQDEVDAQAQKLPKKEDVK